MGIYLNPGNENFKLTLAGDIYVDKTKMIAAVNRLMDKGEKYICLSRPRRFGKTIASNMLCSYYSKGCDSRELFAPYKISNESSFEEKLNKFNVIKIDWNFEYQNIRKKSDVFDFVTEKILEEFEEEFPEIIFSRNSTIADVILKVYAKTGETFVFLMDEYDVFIREQADESIFKEYLSLLNALFKSDTLGPAISMAYITGILPVVRDRVQSKLNNFREYTIIDALSLSEYVGFTTQEVEKLCIEHNIDFNQCRQWYDGYSQNGFELYNPESVVMSMKTGRFGTYWNRTSTYMVIAERLRMNFDGTKDAVIRMLAGETIEVNVDRYMNTIKDFASKDDVFTYLIHLGYLAYDIDNETCRIPNREVRKEWINAIADDKDYSATNRIIESSRQLLSDTLSGDEEAVAKALDISHIHVTSNRSYNNEDALASAIYLSYIYALNEYTCVKEMTAGKGFADVVYIPVSTDKPAMIIELKRNVSTGAALEQIHEKKYFDCLQHYQGQLILVGINYDEATKTHTCRIEEFEK